MFFAWKIFTCAGILLQISTSTTQTSHEALKDGLLGKDDSLSFMLVFNISLLVIVTLSSYGSNYIETIALQETREL